MLNSKLSDYFAAFSKQDWKDFRKIAQSKTKPESDISILIDHIYRYNQNLNQPQLKTDYICTKLFNGKTRKSVLNLYSQVTALVKNYLIQDELSHEDYFRQIFLLKAYNRRLLYKKADKLHQQVSHLLKKEKIDFWPALYQQLIDHHYYFSNNPKTAKKKLHITIQSAINNAELYHDQIRALYKYETVNRVLSDRLDFEGVVDNFTFKNHDSDQVVRIFKQITEMIQYESTDIATRLRLEFNSNHHEITETIRIIIYLALKMHYAKKVNNGDLAAAPKVFELHKLMSDNNYFFNNGQLNALGFINIASLASFLNENEWLYNFIKKYGPHLPSETRKNTIALATAHLYYSRQEYDLSIGLINQTYFKNINLKSMAGRLQLINYIDSNIEDTYFLKQKIENYRLLIYRNQKNLSKRVVKSSFNLIKILQLIVDKKDVEQIRMKIDKMNSIFYRYYINSKLNKIAQE